MLDTSHLVITVAEPEADDERRDELAGGLLRYLRSADVTDARRSGSGTAVPGTRGMDSSTVGALLVALQGTAGLLSEVSSVVALVRDWLALGKGPARTISVTYGDLSCTLGCATAEEQDRLVAAFLKAMAAAERRKGH